MHHIKNFKQISPILFGLIFSALFSSTISGIAHAEDVTRWVHGSWVNVRQSAEAQSTVIGQVTTNTKVSLLTQNGKACEIGWGESQRGFVPCNLLGDRPLTLAETAQEFLPLSPPKYEYEEPRKNPQYSPPRAFWIAPSAAALFKAGEHFQRTLLPEKQRHLEDGYKENGECCGDGKPPKLVRYPIPEFEAMKALLDKGIVTAADFDPPLLTCQQMQQARKEQTRTVNNPATAVQADWSEWVSPNWHYPGYERFPYNPPYIQPLLNDCRVPGMPKLHLPAIRPSLFKDTREILPGNTVIEQISAHFGIMERGQVTGGPRWEFPRHGSWHYTGAWDIGRYDLKLERPIVEHAVGRTGLIGAYEWTPQTQFKPNGDDGNCVAGMNGRRQGKTLLPDYPTVKDALFWFQAPAALPFRKAKITTRNESVPVKMPDASKGALQAAIYEVDLDQDGVADFVQWDLKGPPEITNLHMVPILRIVFININGEWYPFEIDFYSECT